MATFKGSVQYTLNKNDQVATYTDLNGTIVTNTYDPDGRLTMRTAIPAAGVAGAANESFVYDGLGRFLEAANNQSSVHFSYDKAGRLDYEIQELLGENGIVVASNKVDYEYDGNGNVTQITYPSNKVLSITPDELDRVSHIKEGNKSLVSYGYEGVGKVTRENLQGVVTMEAHYDEGRRPDLLTYKGAGNQTLFNKSMQWNLLDLKDFDKEGDKGEEYKYDSALRLRNVKDTENNTETKYEIDGNENIDAVTETKGGVTAASSYAYNERHQLQGVGLSYDKNGNLVGLDGIQYVYDWKNQLVKVITGTGVNIEYKYDALGRRIEKAVKDPTRTAVTRFVLSGQQVIEERDENNRLTARYAYGNGIDEPVEIEKDIDGNGTLESYIPMQNTNGSVMGIADSSGKLKEKVNYSAYGVPTFIYDHEPPRVDQVRVDSGKVYIRFSEPVDEVKARGAIKVKRGVDVLSGSFAFDEKKRRAIFTPSSALPQNELLMVLVTTDLEDFFGNKLVDEFSRDFTFVGESVIIYDRAAPEVEVVKMIENEFFVEFSEEIHPGTIADSINITTSQGTLTGVTTQEDDKTLKFIPGNTLTASVEYTINVKTTLTDWSGKNLGRPFSGNFVNTGNDALIYEKLEPSEHKESAISNNILFQGREYESETGLYYFRARYYNPKLGRFLQTDPMGYEDSMNLYQSFGNNPVNFIDPMGALSVKKWILGGLEGLTNFAIGLGQALTPMQSPIQSSVNFTDPNLPIIVNQLDTRTAWEKLQDATIVKPTADFAVDIITNAYFGVIKKNVSSEVRDEYQLKLSRNLGQVTGMFILTKATKAGIKGNSAADIITNLEETASKEISSINSGSIIKYNSKAGRFYDSSTGRFIKNSNIPWPENEGFVNSKVGMAKPGQMIDRFGPETGNFFAPKGTQYSGRGIPEGYTQYNSFEVLKPFPWEEGVTKGVPEFNSKGGGYQYKTYKSVKELVAEGYLKRIKKGE